KAIIDGREVPIKGGIPTIRSRKRGRLDISWPLTNVRGRLEMRLMEDVMEIRLTGNSTLDWFFELDAPNQQELPFTAVGGGELVGVFEGYGYQVSAVRGRFSKPADSTGIFRISPEKARVVMDMVTPLQ